MDHEAIDRTILEGMPHFIAVNYQRLLDTKTAQERVKLALHTYNLGLRALTIGLVSQYLIRDRDQISDSYLNNLLLQKFPHLTIDAWQHLLFATLRAYEGHGDLFFMSELYDFYWDTSTLPHRQHSEVEQPFTRLTQIALEIQTKRVVPSDEFAWAALADETTDLLQQVLKRVSFIGQYDLIRVLSYDVQFYTFELHKGLTITQGQRPLPKGIELGRGWFYLREEPEELLPLYPFLVFWEEHSTQAETDSTDVGIYDKFIYERLQYLLVTLGKTINNDATVSDFIKFLYVTIEEAKRQREIAEKLTWWQLRDICKNITDRRMATVAAKYRREVYLQRDKTRQAFERFLQSAERCFVLIGKSGVGKSNFFLALSEELARSRSDISILMYDSTSLKVEPSVTAVISQDFDDRLVLAGQRISEVWREIAKIDGIEDKLVILFVDAINEHPQARQLLRQLDELVQSPWPWLKLVFSSRPETWQTIKRGVRLSEGLYYREEGAETLGVELEGFSYSERMEPFSGQELPHVYAKYQDAFKLQTPYAEVAGELRGVLRDPLSLWLVASTYKEQAIPESLQVTELIAKYVDALVKSGRLQTEDLQLLEKRLVPLMVREGQYTNVLSTADIDAAGEGLYESIYSEQTLSDGQRVNRSFHNLLDTEILTRQTEGRDQNISFKYERFYEYFVGKALYENLKDQNIWQGQYIAWLSHLPQSPFLWGAMKSCLEQQLQSLPAEACGVLCMQLAYIDNQRMKEILITALTEYGQGGRAKTEQVLKFMLVQQRSWWQRAIRSEAMSAQCPVWKQVAIVVASNLRASEQLELALIDPTPAVRAVAMRHAYIFWRQQREAGFALVERLVGRSTGLLGVPLPRIFESCIGISLLILFADFHNSETTSRLHNIWRQAIERLLWVDPQRLGSKRERVKGWVRTLLMRLFSSFVIRTGNEVTSNSLLNIPEFKRFYQRDSDLERRRRILRILISYLDTTATDISDLRDELLMLAPERDLLIAVLALAVLQKHGILKPEITLPLVQELFNRSIEVDPPGPFAGAVPRSAFILEAIPYWDEQSLDHVKTSLSNMFTTYLDRFQGKWQTDLHEYRFTFPDQITWWEAGGSVDVPVSPTAKRYVEQMIEKHDYAWLKDIIKWELTVNGVEIGYLRLTFSVLELALNVPDPSVQASIIELLARMRVYYPDEVDNFMEINNQDEQFMATVRTSTPSETIGDLLNVRALQFWLEAIVLGSSPAFWDGVLWLLKQLPESRNLEQFVVILLKFMVNHVYGEAVFTDVPV